MLLTLSAALCIGKQQDGQVAILVIRHSSLASEWEKPKDFS
jgi:hypothetical protein